MRIKLYIVTYKNDYILEKNLDSLASSDFLDFDNSVHIINNHSDLNIDTEKWASIFKEFVIINNSVRPDMSAGHISRDWNCAIIDGFKDLDNPECDIVAACQNDTVFLSNWASYIKDLHLRENNNYDFLQFGGGDNYMSWTPNGVKRIGLWDERFCALSHQEGDYFLRARLYHPDGASINDNRKSRVNKGWPPHIGHHREHNPLKNKVVDISFTHHVSNHTHHQHARNKRIVGTSVKIFKSKWGTIASGRWDTEEYPDTPLIDSYITYPWFECNIDKATLDAQRYVYSNFFIEVDRNNKKQGRKEKKRKQKLKNEKREERNRRQSLK